MSKQTRSPSDEIVAACLAMANAVGSALTRYLEEMRPAFDALAKLAADTAVRAELARRETQGVGRASACHCLCVVGHPGDRGICDGDSVMVVRRWSNGIANVDVPMCGPCAAVQMRGESR